MRSKRLMQRCEALLRNGKDANFIKEKVIPSKMREDRVARFVARMEAKEKAKRKRW